jgi:hypothetical protein
MERQAQTSFLRALTFTSAQKSCRRHRAAVFLDLPLDMAIFLFFGPLMIAP